MNESEIQKVYIYKIYPRDSTKFFDKGFVNIDNGSLGGSHWTCFIIKDKKPYYFGSFGGQPDNVLLKQLLKPIMYQKYKRQDINFKLCYSFCLYFMCLIETMNYYDVVLKISFD